MNQSITSSPQGSRVPFVSQGVITIKVIQNKEISGNRNNGGGENESVPLSVEKEQIGGAQTLRKESEEELISEMLNPA